MKVFLTAVAILSPPPPSPWAKYSRFLRLASRNAFRAPAPVIPWCSKWHNVHCTPARQPLFVRKNLQGTHLPSACFLEPMLVNCPSGPFGHSSIAWHETRPGCFSFPIMISASDASLDFVVISLDRSSLEMSDRPSDTLPELLLDRNKALKLHLQRKPS
eukprot:CAMPEP_0176190212 /NCGR_PEP_ID=MMETSP0121_2-20121125/3823_1 /TAXON_ID=160619 /ORGANISM="Kryptoperidinium foliaceum, Strain CCMP 1326" /LENGTH=158 /DNA_ID=CAMNT_0017528829 /DNA_START=120 /DNA_END=593 /DNA_ORIENTATION=+